MDTTIIDRINKYNEGQKIQHAPVLLRKKKNLEAEVYVVTIGCTREEFEEIRLTRVLSTSLLNQLKGFKFPLEEYIDTLLYLGDLNNFKSYAMFIYQFPQRKIDIRNRVEPQFRLYTKTLQEQKDTSCYIRNLCNSAKESWQSVVKKVGSRYGVVFTYKVPINKNNNE